MEQVDDSFCDVEIPVWYSNLLLWPICISAFVTVSQEGRCLEASPVKHQMFLQLKVTIIEQ